MSGVLIDLLNAQLDLGFGKPILWREIIGNVFGLASMLLGMRRKVWAWPIGIVGNLLLFTVFCGALFHTPQNLDLWGQAIRQIFFLIVSAYGWVVWAANRRHSAADGGQGESVIPRWATWRERGVFAVIGVVMWVVFYYGLSWIGSWGPAADAWILTGTILANIGMARGWVEFWWVWIAVDLVGVPLLLMAHFYPSAIMYGVYLVLCVWGFAQWWSYQRAHREVTMPAR